MEELRYAWMKNVKTGWFIVSAMDRLKLLNDVHITGKSNYAQFAEMKFILAGNKKECAVRILFYFSHFQK